MDDKKQKEPGSLPDEEELKEHGPSPKNPEERNEATIPADRGNWERRSTTQGSE